MASIKDKLGTVDAYNHYSVGWAWAMCTRYQWTKQVASHWGGTRNGTIVHWPTGINSEPGVRSQFCHVIDVAPTILEAAGLPHPDFVNGVGQAPIEGTSMIYTFEDPDAPERHDLQYFEMFGNRGIYFRGWSAVTRHSTPWLPSEVLPALDDDIWELFPGMKRLNEGSVLDIKNRSFSVTASIDAAAAGPTNGVIIAQGGRFGGWALFFADGRAKFVYNLLGMQEFVVGATEVLAAGHHQVRSEFAYDGGGLAKGGTVTLYYDGVRVGAGRVDMTQPLVFSADETTDIGNDYGMPISAEYAGASKFNGRIDVVQIDVGDDDQSHLIDPEQVAMVAISRQ